MRNARVARIERQGDDPNKTFQVQEAERTKRMHHGGVIHTLDSKMEETSTEKERAALRCLEESDLGEERQAKRARGQSEPF